MVDRRRNNEQIKMSRTNKQRGFTLPEQIIVVAGIVLLAAIAMPAIKAFFKTFESTDAAKTMISSALTTAQSIAIKQQRYAGIRFQIAGYHGPSIDEENRDKLMKGGQYIIFIVHDPDKTDLASGFRAVQGIAPIKLPDSVGVMDLKRRDNKDASESDYIDITKSELGPDTELLSSKILRDTTSFSIVFSPQGKLVVHDVRIRNRNGVRETSGQALVPSLDDVFNTLIRVSGLYKPSAGQFVQDDYAELGLGQEPGRRSFIIYEKEKLKEAYNSNEPYSGYLIDLDEVYINPYTGTIINPQKQED